MSTVKSARQRASEVLDLVGLDEARFRPVGGFSTGMRQRTKLAQARHATVRQPSPIPLVTGPVTESPAKPQYNPSDPAKGAPPVIRLQPGIAVDATQLGLEAVGGVHQPATWNPTPSDVALFHGLATAPQ